MHYLFITLRILGAALGVFLIYVSLFTYEDTAKQVRNRLYELWFQLYDVQLTSKKFDFIITRTIKSVYSFFLNYFNGGKFSYQFFGSCGIAFLISATLLIIPAKYIVDPSGVGFSGSSIVVQLGVGFTLLGLWIFFPRLSQKKYVFFFLALSIIVISLLFNAIQSFQYDITSLCYDIMGLVVAFLFFTSQVYITILFNRISYRQSLKKQKRLLLMNLLLLAADIATKLALSVIFLCLFLLILNL